MSEEERIEQGFKILFIKLLMAKSDEDRKVALEPLKKGPAAEQALLILAQKIQDGQISFHNKAIELNYDNHREKDLDEFKAALTLTSNEIPDFLAQDTNIPVTWSSLEKANKAASIAWMAEVKRRNNQLQYESVIGLGLFEADPKVNHAPDNQALPDPTDNNIAEQNTQVLPTATTRISKTLPNSKPNTPAPSQSNSFADLFENADELAKCIEILRAYRPKKPVINDRNTWMGKERDGSKGILIAWVDRLVYCEKIKKIAPKELVPLLEDHFSGLKFGKDLRYFGNPMEADFSKLMPK